jgi:hypothetical protein
MDPPLQKEVIGMNEHGSRLAGVSGILFVVVAYAGVILGDKGILGGPLEPPPVAGGGEWVTYYTSNLPALLSRNYLGALAFCFFLIFVGACATPCGRVRRNDGYRCSGCPWRWGDGDRLAAGIDGGVVGGE